MARIYKSEFTVPSDSVQGAGSWVKFRRATWGIIKGLRESEDGASGLPLLAALIVDWNWTDDNGDPLPLPSIQPDILDNMPGAETRWLVDASEMNGGGQKN